MKYKDFFDMVINFLCEDPAIDISIIKKHWEPQYNKPNDFKIIYKRLCESAQNQGMSPKIISHSINEFNNLGLVLDDFDPLKVATKYKIGENIKLFDEIKLKLHPKGKLRDTNKSIWPKFCNAIIEGAHYLSTFDSSDKFYLNIDNYVRDKRIKNVIPILLAFEMKGFGIALVCDFIKELGYKEYGKPDVHIKEILSAAGYLQSNEVKTIEGSYKSLTILDIMSEELGISQYEIDKSIWLIGSGNYYNTNLSRRPNRKVEFISRLKN